MKLVVTSLVAIIFVAAGSFGAILLKSPSEASAATKVEKDDDHSGDDYAKDEKKDKKKSAKKGDGYDKEKSSGDSAYYKFSREFVVPIMRGGQVTSLVILHISLETDSATSERLFSEEPKLRDNIMTTLIGLSNDGRTLERPTDINNYETIRSVILMNLKDSIDSGIKNVLIVDMAKQNL